MASKRSTIARQKEANKKKYEKICASLTIFFIVSLALLGLGLILYFVPWAQNYNYDKGVMEEQPVGWIYIVSTLSNGFTKLYGSGNNSATMYFDLSLLYYPYAPSYTIALGVITVLSLVALICSAVFYCIVLFTKKYKFIYFAVAAQIVLFVLLLAALINAYLYNASGIYIASASPKGSNFCDPAQCRMQTLIYFPLIAALAGMVVGIVAAVKYGKARALLNKIQ